ncbi:hypothetical protein BH23BAC2_BH23BAC2_09100 [soil metagenome]
MPPNTLKAGMVSPKISKIYFPITIKAVTMMKATKVDVLAILLFCFWSSPSVSLIKIGMLTMGFMMAKKAINTVNE